MIAVAMDASLDLPRHNLRIGVVLRRVLQDVSNIQLLVHHDSKHVSPRPALVVLQGPAALAVSASAVQHALSGHDVFNDERDNSVSVAVGETL